MFDVAFRDTFKIIQNLNFNGICGLGQLSRMGHDVELPYSAALEFLAEVLCTHSDTFNIGAGKFAKHRWWERCYGTDCRLIIVDQPI